MDPPPPQTGIEGAWASNQDNTVVISSTQTRPAPDRSGKPGKDSPALPTPTKTPCTTAAGFSCQ
ncbi:hypothetical protein, partial [Microbacterium sp. LB12]|uniref:hypothetical protein n=1 Tax=Microbacterium sp. LB12 TaxID=3081270 RepID=UPI00301648A6